MSWKYERFLKYLTIPEGMLAFRQSTETAVICGSQTLSWQEFLSRSQGTARSLMAAGISKGSRVVLCMERSADFIAALFGILYAGASYVAVDPEWPEERLGYIVNDSRAKLVLTDEIYQHLQEQEAQEGLVLPSLSGKDEICVYYTSGSSGKPKGTVTHHQVFLHEALPLENNSCACDTIEHCETFISMGNFAYGATACDIMSCMFYGKTLVLATAQERADPGALGRLMLRTHADAMLGTPSQLLMYLENQEFASGFAGLKRLILTGEALSDHALSLIGNYTGASIYDAFGASEVRNYAISRVIPGMPIRVGHPVPGARLLVLDEADNPVLPGEEGELCIGGIPAELGYYPGNEALTNQKFTENAEFGRLYHTGDLAIREKDGSVRMAGRKDGMKKLHGQRLELSEIERCMEGFAHVLRAAADIRGEGEKAVLCAWYISEEKIDEEALKSRMAQQLPAYMIPLFIKEVPDFPLNDSGKLNRSALPDIIPASIPEKSFSGTAAEHRMMQKFICDAFESILKTGRAIDPAENFFLIGGNSIRAMQLAALLNEQTGKHYTLSDLFLHPTPESLANAEKKSDIGGEEAGEDPVPVPEELAVLRSDPHVEAVLRVSNSTFLYLSLSRFEVKDRRNVSRIRAELNGNFTQDEFRDRVRILVENHPALRSSFVQDDGKNFWQVIHTEKEVPAYYKDLRFLSSEAAERFIEGFWQVMEENGALFCAALFIVGDGKNVLLLRSDHSIADGMSLQVIQNELAAPDYRDLGVDDYISHRKRSLAAASVIPDFLYDYYRDMHITTRSRELMHRSKKRETTLIRLTAEETARLQIRCASAGCTIYTQVQLCYAQVLLSIHGVDEIWLMHVDNGRDENQKEEMRLVGNIMAGMPIRITRSMRAAGLQWDLLRLHSFAGLPDARLMRPEDCRGIYESIISDDFAQLSGQFTSSRIVDRPDAGGNDMEIRNHELVIRFRHADDPQTKQWYASLSEKLRLLLLS